MKIVVNKCFGGFSVSKAVYDALGLEWDGYGYLDNSDLGIDDDDAMAYRCNAKLIAAIESVGEKSASGGLASIRIVDIPEGIEWEIGDYDGLETVHEKHRSW